MCAGQGHGQPVARVRLSCRGHGQPVARVQQMICKRADNLWHRRLWHTCRCEHVDGQPVARVLLSNCRGTAKLWHKRPACLFGWQAESRYHGLSATLGSIFQVV